MSVTSPSDGEKAPASWGQAVYHALGDGNPVQGATYTVFYDSADGEYKARNGTDGTIEYHGTDAAAVIQSVITAVPAYGSIVLKGSITITSTLNFDLADVKRLRFTFDRIKVDANVDGINIGNWGRPLIIRGLLLETSFLNYDHALVKIGDAYRVIVDIQQLGGDATGGKTKGIQVELAAGQAMYNSMVHVTQSYWLESVLYVHMTGDSWASINHFDLGFFEGVSPRQIYVYKEGTDSFHNNVITGSGGKISDWNPQSLTPVWTIKLETSGSGGIYGTTFRDFWIYDAEDEIYRADSGVHATSFIGGMPRVDVTAWWHDGGSCTDFISCYTSMSVGATRYSKLNAGQNIEHHTANDTLLTMEAGTIHTNLGAGGNIKLTLPQDATAGTQFEFVVMTAAQQLQVDPGAAGAIYINGAKQTDDAYIWADDEAESVKLVADGNGDWIAIGTVGTWTVV